MTVNEVVEATLNRVAESSRIHPDERRASAKIERASKRLEPREFESLLQRALEVLTLRARGASSR